MIKEAEFIQRIAQEYQAKGYQVLIEPCIDMCPDFLKKINYRPDIIAKSKQGNIIIECKISNKLADYKQYLEQLSELIKKQDDWDFELVLFRLDDDFLEITNKTTSVEPGSIEESISEINKLVENKFYNAAIIIIWALIEYGLRVLLLKRNKNINKYSTKDLIRDATTLGMISRDDYFILSESQKLRNNIVHGMSFTEANFANTSKLLVVMRNILNELVSS